MKHSFFLWSCLCVLVAISSCRSPSDGNKTFTLQTDAQPAEGGTVSPSSSTFPEGEVVTLQAEPNNGWLFVRWEGDLSGAENPASLDMAKNQSVTGVFEKRNYSLNLVIEGEGTVQEKVTKTKDYPFQTTVELTAVAAEGWRFEGWSGDYEGPEAVIEITITDDTDLTAVFIRREYELDIEIEGRGTVQEEVVTAKSYPYQTRVQLTAIPDTDWEFDAWSGDLSGSANPEEITIDEGKQVTATFIIGAVPEVKTGEVTNIASMSARVDGTVSWEGTTEILERGVCYSTDENPSVEDDCVTSENEQDHFTVKMLHLQPLTRYYARAYVSVGVKVYYGNQVNFSTIFDLDACGKSVTVRHQTNDGVSPQNATITYSTAFYEEMCWITQNLGANSVAGSADDDSENAAGWYWQFNRKQGYSNSGSGPEPRWQINEIEENQNWQPENDPCTETFGDNWRILTLTEWLEAINWQPSDINGAYGAPLKIHMGGILGSSSGTLSGRGSSAMFWSSSQEGLKQGRVFRANKSIQEMASLNKANGRSVRCVYSERSAKHVPNLEITGVDENMVDGVRISARIINEGTSSVQEKGVCYSTHPKPDISDSCISGGSGSADYSIDISGLIEEETYYARAYAVNSTGRAYSTEVSFEGVSEGGSVESDIYVYALAAPDLTREIFINWIDQSSGADGTKQTFRYGAGSQLNQEESATGRKIPHANAWVYSVRLTSLNPATAYSGRVYQKEKRYTDLMHFETLPSTISGSDRVAVAFMSDIHIDKNEIESVTVPGNPVNSMNDPEMMRFVQQKNIHILSIVGDIVSNGYNVDETRTDQYIGFFRDHIHTYLNADKLIPLFVVPGNHEVGFPLRGEGGVTEPTPEAGYFQLFFNNLYETTGYNFGTAKAGNYLQLMGLDMFSSTPEEQKDFFDENVNSSVSGVIPFFHSPMLEGGVRSPEDVQYSDKIRRQLAPSFADQNNIYSYFTGHLHLKFRSKPWNVIESETPPPHSLSLGNNKYLIVDETRNRLVEFGQGYRSNRTPYTTEDKTWYIDDASVAKYNVFFTVTLQSGQHIVTEYNHNGTKLYSKDLRGGSD